MVLINDKKFACATCIKGHRVSGCTHTDRALFEVKKKGRPATQCQCCKDKRKSGNVHNKCVCGDPKAPEVILPPGHAGVEPDDNPYHGVNSGANSADERDHDMDEPESSTTAATKSKRRETKKGRPGDQATFPNGLRDVHEMAAAAEVLNGMGEDPMRSAERSVARLLNPCTCRHTGICKCCEPKRPRNHPNRSRSPSVNRQKREDTDILVEHFKARAPSPSPFGSSASSPNPSGPSPTSPMGRYSSSNTLPVPGMNADGGISPDNLHHPAHTSRRVHKTKLFSPYSTDSGHKRRNSASRRSISSSSVKSLRLKPLADLNKFLAAAINPDGSTANEISRSAVGLPGIQSFDEMARKAGVKVEALDAEDGSSRDEGTTGDGEMDIDRDKTPLAFPTSEDVVLGACTCGEDCDCPGCTTHSNGEASSSSSHSGALHECGRNCRSHFDCGAELPIPSGIASIDQLLSVAASAVPKPMRHRPLDMLATDTSLLPPSAAFSPDAAAGLGVVDLKPLQCCNGRCQCTPGSCGCKEDCCGCCVRCACAEDAPTPTAENPNPSIAEGEKGSCCGGTGSKQGLSISTSDVSSLDNTPPRLSPNAAVGHPFNMSPLHSPLIHASNPTSANPTMPLQHRQSLSISSLPSPLIPPSPGLLHPPGPGSSSGSSCCSPASNTAPLLQVNTSIQHSPFGSPAHSPSAESFHQLPSPGMPSSGTIDPSAFLPGGQATLGISPGSVDAANVFRRASSPGHGHSQSVSGTSTVGGLGNRRSTIGGAQGQTAAGVQRSASTGKQASKALALHQQPNHAGQVMHVRPILPKPPATLLAPPKGSSGSSSRPTSPGGRRRSSSSMSRAASPSLGGANTVGNGRPSAHQHTASESAIGAQHGRKESIGGADHMAIPMVTTSAPGETWQEVSFDPNEERSSSEERSDAEQGTAVSGQAADGTQSQGGSGDGSGLLGQPLHITPELAQMFQAWLVQNGHVRSDQNAGPTGSHHQAFGPSSMSGQPLPNHAQPLPHNVSITPSFEQGMNNQFSTANLSGQDMSSFPSLDPAFYATLANNNPIDMFNNLGAGMNDNQSVFDVYLAMQAQMQNQGLANPSFEQMQQFQAQGMQMAMLHQQQQQQQQQQQAPFQQSSPGYYNNMSGFFAPPMPHVQQQNASPISPGGSWQMPLNLPQANIQHPQRPRSGSPYPDLSSSSMANDMSQMGFQHSLQPQNYAIPNVASDTALGPQPNPATRMNASNMIDLDRPLDSSDLDRIIKALQGQQSRQQTQTQTQRPPSSQSNHTANSSLSTNYTGAGGAGQAHGHGHHIPNQSGHDMPPPPVPPPRLGHTGHSLSQSHIGDHGTRPGMFGEVAELGSRSGSASGQGILEGMPFGAEAGTSLSSSAPQSQGYLGPNMDPNPDLNSQMASQSNTRYQPPSHLSHTPSFSISSFDSFLLPPSSGSSASGGSASGSAGGGHSGRTSFTLGTEPDVFEQFILENHGEGLDLSALDLGAQGQGQGAVKTYEEGSAIGVGAGMMGKKGNSGEGDDNILSEYTFF